MKLVSKTHLQNSGAFFDSKAHQQIDREIRDAIKAIHWPADADSFSINPKRKGNGVKPIKQAFVEALKKKGWEAEARVSLVDGLRAGPVDVVKTLPDGSLFVVEWETGNISSSHRAVNKILTSLLESEQSDNDLNVVGGALVLPTRKLYRYLTDRIGNLEELQPYFPLWKHVSLKSAAMTVYAVEHDHEDSNLPTITKMTDGRALV